MNHNVLLLMSSLALLPAEDTGNSQKQLQTVEDCVASVRVMLKSVPDVGMSQAAQDFMDRYWYDKEQAASDKRQLGRQMNAMEAGLKQYGDPDPAQDECLGVVEIGKNTIKVVYIEHMANAPLPWSVRFYKTGTHWVVYGFNFGDQALDDMNRFGVLHPSK